MVAALPRFRTDLTVSRQVTEQGTVFVIKDPVREKFFRLPEEAHFVAGQLDGATPLEVVRERTEQHFRTPVPFDTVQSFVRHLGTAGLLDTGKKSAGPRRRPRLAGSLLYLRYRLFDPDRLFNRLAGRVGFFYTPGFLALSGGLILAAAAVALANWEDALRDLARLYQLAAIPVVMGVIFAVITAHEFAHGLTCKRFGGEVHELGFYLVYFQPALYCNVSDAWLFPEKAKRLWVGFAGPYFELFLWALATLAWRLTDVESWVNYVALVVMTSSGLKTLLNFNPLIKLDGYYLLSDWLGIPNLRTRAFAWLGGKIKRCLGAGAAAAAPATARERRIYLTYGLVATAGSFSLLGFAVTQVGGYLVEQGQPLALALFTGLLGTKVHRRLRRLFGRSAGPDEGELFADPPESGEPPPPTAGPPSARRAASGRWWSRGLKWIALAGLAAAGLWFGRMELRINGSFAALPLHNADVRAEVEGLVESVAVDEGVTVRAGDLIAQLADRDVRAELQKTESGIDRARANLALLKAGPTEDEVRLAQTSVEKTESQLKFARSDLARSQVLVEKSLLTQVEYEKTQAALAMAENDRKEAEARLKLLRDGARLEQVEAAQAELAGLETQRAYLAGQLQRLRITSPADGVVATPSRQLKAMMRQLVKPGDLIAKVHELGTVTAEIAISERDIGDIKVGQPVVVKARAYPELTFNGRVVSIATVAWAGTSSSSSSATAGSMLSGAANFSSTGSATPRIVFITTEVDNSSGLLKPEMTGQAKVSCGERRLLDLATRRIARIVKVEFWSWW